MTLRLGSTKMILAMYSTAAPNGSCEEATSKTVPLLWKTVCTKNASATAATNAAATNAAAIAWPNPDPADSTGC